MQTIVEMKFGSFLYGTSTPASDTDFKAVHLPDARDILLGTVAHTIHNNTKTDQSARNTADDTDHESFALKKYLDLLAQGNTVALDMYFAPEWALTKPPSFIWQKLRDDESRKRLITRQCKSFLGYCREQANKYGIKGSRMAAAEAANGYFKMHNDVGLGGKRLQVYGTILEKTFSGIEHIEFVDILNPAGAVVRHISVCGKKVPYTATIKEAHSVYSNLYDKYGERSRAAKDNQGIDWKALSHAVRVGHQAIELLTTGHITFPRPEAAQLVRIKTGHKTFAKVSDELIELMDQVEQAAAKSVLPTEPDRKWIDDFVIDQYRHKVQWDMHQRDFQMYR